jgi:hypothetical protein
MNHKNAHIWIWLQENILHKAVYIPLDKIFIVYNDQGEIILKRIGITPEQLSSLEVFLLHLGARRIDGQKEPFTYL